MSIHIPKSKMPPTGPNHDFALRLRGILEAQGLSYSRFAKLAGLDSAVMYRLVIGERTPNYKTLIKIIETLQCKFSDLTGVG